MLDEPSLPWSDGRLQRLHQVLVSAFDSSAKVMPLARQTEGFPVDLIKWDDNARTLWESVLAAAARAGVLRLLIEKALADPTVAGFRRNIEAALAQCDDARPPLPSRLAAARETTVLGARRGKVDEILARTAGEGSSADFVRLLWVASPDIGPLPVGPLSGASGMLDVLDERTFGRFTVPPVIAFLEYLAEWLPAAGEALRKITAEVALAERIDPGELLALRARAMEMMRAETRLLVEVHIMVRREDDGRLTSSALLYREGTVASYRQDGPAARPPQEIRTVVESMIERFQPLLEGLDLADLRFEFVVPWTLLGEALDGWEFPDGRALGSRSQVVVRSLERMQSPMLVAAWRKRSRYLRDCSTTPDEVVGLLPPDTPAGAGIAGQERLACLVIPRPYTPPKSWREADLLLDGIKDGLPAAIWYRDGGEPAKLLAHLLAMAETGDLTALPAEVLKWRLQAQSERSDHADRQITLLWDDFQQQPELIAPGEPARQGGDR